MATPLLPTLPTPLLAHVMWPLLLPWVRIQTYDRDGGHAHPRHRIELEVPPLEPFRQAVRALTIPCVSCGALIHPLREREGGGRGKLYVAVTCPLARRLGCARGSQASEAYEQIVAAVQAAANGR